MIQAAAPTAIVSSPPVEPPAVPRRGLRARLIILGVATGVGLLDALRSYVSNRLNGEPVGVGWVIVENLPWWYLWLMAVPVIVFLSRRFRFDSSRWWVALPVHLVASVVLSMLHLLAYSVWHWYLLSQGLLDVSLAAQTQRFISAYSFTELMTYWLIVAVDYALLAEQRLRQRAVEAVRLEARAARLQSGLTTAHLEKLRSELNPHFLFNTLNAIAGLVRRQETAGAVEMLACLGELLRLSLDRQPEQTVPLEVELDLLQRYLNVEEVRFRDRLTVTRDIDPGLLRAYVPTLILQPLVENAIKHGIARSPGPGVIRLAAHRENGSIVLQVTNTGPRRRPPPIREGIGLSNTRARLFELYRETGQLRFETEPDGHATTTVSLPLVYTPVEVANADRG